MADSALEPGDLTIALLDRMNKLMGKQSLAWPCFRGILP
jgi:hypothetical protein